MADKTVQTAPATPAAPAPVATPAQPKAKLATPLSTPKLTGDDTSAREWANADESAFAEMLGIPMGVVEEGTEAAAATTEAAEPETTVEDALTESTEATPEGAEAAPETEAEAEPEAEVEEQPKVEDTKPPLTKFAIFDKEGELETPELFFDFTANKKEYTHVPLDKVILWAQMGVRNEATAAEIAQARQEMPALREQNLALTRYMEQLESKAVRLLEDEQYLEQARAAWQAANAPEARIHREREQLQSDRQRMTAELEAGQAAQFVQTQLAPAMETLLKHNPLVSERELLGEYTQLIAPYLVSGRVPIAQLPKVKQLVDTELAETVRGLHTQREAERQQSTAKVTKARQIAAQAKRTVARAVAPKGGAAAPPEQAKQRRFESVSDWQKDLGGLLAPVPDDD